MVRNIYIALTPPTLVTPFGVANASRDSTSGQTRRLHCFVNNATRPLATSSRISDAVRSGLSCAMAYWHCAELAGGSRPIGRAEQVAISYMESMSSCFSRSRNMDKFAGIIGVGARFERHSEIDPGSDLYRQPVAIIYSSPLLAMNCSVVLLNGPSWGETLSTYCFSASRWSALMGGGAPDGGFVPPDFQAVKESGPASKGVCLSTVAHY